MQLYIASALAFAAGVAVAAAWPTIRTRASYWAGYATGRYTKLRDRRFIGVDLASGPVTIAPPVDRVHLELGAHRFGKTARRDGARLRYLRGGAR